MCFRVAIVARGSYFVVDDRTGRRNFYYFKFVDVILKAAGDFKSQPDEKK